MAAMADWLRKVRKLRPGREPETEILKEIFLASTGLFPCPNCGRRGLNAGRPADELVDWPGQVLCSSCSKPIARERLEALPGTRLCATCQADEEAGRTKGDVEYCPRCGAPMELRLSRSNGITRYVLTCTAQPPCRR